MRNYFQDKPIMLGVAFAFVETILFAFVGLFVRLASEAHHTMDIMMYRHGIGLAVFALILSFRKDGWKKARQANMKLQLLRAVVGTLAMVGAFATFSYLSLSEAQSLFYAGPLFALFLSYPLLKEKVGWRRMSAAAVGFIGVLLIAQPANISSLIGGVMGIATAVGFAGVMIVLRWLGKTEDVFVTAFYFALFGTVMILPFQPFFWVMPSVETLLYMSAAGLIAVGVQITLTKAYFLAPPSVIAPVTYLCLLWSIVLDFVMWQQWPLWGTIAGAGLIILSNAFIVYREAKLHQEKSVG